MDQKNDAVSKENNTYGVTESFEAKTVLDLYYEEINRDGFTLLKNVFSSEDCQIANQKIDEVYQEQIREVGGEDYLKSIHDHDNVRALFIYDDFFLRFINNELILSICQRLFGQKFILYQQNSPINRPYSKHYGSAWHRDLPHQHFVPSRPISISVVICLDDFTEENGGTHVLNGSHKHEIFPSENYCKKNDIQIIANAGDALFFDSLLFHKAGNNNTDKVRRLLVEMFTLPFIKQQVNIPKMLGGKYSDDPELSYLMGYESEVEESVLSWRKRAKRRFENNG